MQFGKRANLQGIGRQSKEIVERTGKADTKAVSDMLGKKQFIMGDEITLVSVFLNYCYKKHIY